MPNHHDGDRRVIDTVRLSEDDIDAILTFLDSGKGDVPIDKRLNRRFTYRQNPGLVLTIHQPDGNMTRYRVIPRDISASGLGLLVGTFVYTGNCCSIALQSIADGVKDIPGRIVRCVHIRGRLHEIAIQLDHEIDLAQFIGGGQEAPDDEPDVFNPPALQGTILCMACVLIVSKGIVSRGRRTWGRYGSPARTR